MDHSPGNFVDGRNPHPRAKGEFKTSTPGPMKTSQNLIPGAFSSIIHYKNIKNETEIMWNRKILSSLKAVPF